MVFKPVFRLPECQPVGPSTCKNAQPFQPNRFLPGKLPLGIKRICRIEKMQKLSGAKQNYEVICQSQKTYFEVGGRQGFGIYPTQTGIKQKLTSSMPTTMRVRKGETQLVIAIQVHGLGDGCYVIGSDKASTFKRAGSVKKIE